MDYCKFNQHLQQVTPVAGAAPGVLSVLEQINTSTVPGWCASLLWQVPSLPIKMTRSSFLAAGKASNIPALCTFTVPNHPPALCHNSVCRDLDFLSISQDIMWSIALMH